MINWRFLAFFFICFLFWTFFFHLLNVLGWFRLEETATITGKTNEFQLTSSLNFPDFVSNVCEGGNHINNCIDARNQYSSIFKATFVLEEKSSLTSEQLARSLDPTFLRKKENSWWFRVWPNAHLIRHPLNFSNAFDDVHRPVWTDTTFVQKLTSFL